MIALAFSWKSQQIDSVGGGYLRLAESSRDKAGAHPDRYINIKVIFWDITGMKHSTAVSSIA